MGVDSTRFRDKQTFVSVQLIERQIFLIRSHKVMIDVDLARLYYVTTYRLNEAVKRNRRRFPSDFMFQLSKKEAEFLTSQFAISKKGRGGRRGQKSEVFSLSHWERCRGEGITRAKPSPSGGGSKSC